MIPVARRLPAGMGAILIGIYALYGAYVSSRYIMYGSRGVLRSEEFLFFLVVLGLLAVASAEKTLIATVSARPAKGLILLFVAYVLIAILVADSRVQPVYLRYLIVEMGVGFFAGFVAFSRPTWRWSISRSGPSPNGHRTTRRLALAATAMVMAWTVYYSSVYSGRSALGAFLYRSNNYYQDLGDFFIIAVSCLVTLQLSGRESVATPKRTFSAFAVVVAAQAALSFYFLQALGSNKAPVTIVLISAMALYYGKPRNWLLHAKGIHLRALYVVPTVFMLAVVGLGIAQAGYIPNIRLFAYGAESSLLRNPSLQLRWGTLRRDGMEQLAAGPLFGDLSIEDYIHSSIVSTQTHLGAVGSVLLWLFVIMQVRRLFAGQHNDGLKAITGPILLISAVSSVFYWKPLWFLIGSLFAAPDMRDDGGPSDPKRLQVLGRGSCENKIDQPQFESPYQT